MKRSRAVKVSGNVCQECPLTDFHTKHYFLNLLIEETWDAHEQGGMISFNIIMGHNGPNLH
jgi:hypothetical protein